MARLIDEVHVQDWCAPSTTASTSKIAPSHHTAAISPLRSPSQARLSRRLSLDNAAIPEVQNAVCSHLLNISSLDSGYFDCCHRSKDTNCRMNPLDSLVIAGCEDDCERLVCNATSLLLRAAVSSLAPSPGFVFVFGAFGRCWPCSQGALGMWPARLHEWIWCWAVLAGEVWS